MKILVSIAGFDPTSGAGITKDTEVFSSLGSHGLGIPTSIVIQGPSGVKSLHGIPLELFKRMLQSIEDEGIKVGGLKTGVLANEEYIEIIVSVMKEKDWQIPIVVDPVLKAKNGYPLLTEKGIESLKKFLIPLCTMITPNIEEAERLSGIKIVNERDIREAAMRLKEMGARTVIIKGGHLEGDPVDIFYDGSAFVEKRKIRLDRVVHGTGCMFSASVLFFLTCGFRPVEAFFEAEAIVEVLIKEAYKVKEDGYMYSSLSRRLGVLARKFEVINTLREIKERLERLNPVDLIPEVQMNICYALPDAKGIEDVCAFPGRISKHGGKILIKAEPEFGSSSHVARSLIAFMKLYPQVRSCMNLKYSPELLENAKKNGLRVMYFDRKIEPEEIKIKEGKSLDFMIEEVLRKSDLIPDIIYDTGDLGKEPMLRLFARDPFELLEKMEKVLR
ncbi:MAG: PfkB family carbohydrate kinase [Deltaproteobacteria bacterium]|nr:PfkB family carbohydrate kinase [Deltaproteobacteria bacterium]